MKDHMVLTRKIALFCMTAALALVVSVPAAHAVEAAVPADEGSSLALMSTAPAKTKIIDLSAASDGFLVKWKRSSASNVTGYQIRYSTKGSMTSAKTTTASKQAASKKVSTKKTDKMAKTYYVQVRVKAKSGKYSAWSKKKTVTTMVCSGNASFDKKVAATLASKVKKTGQAGLKKAFKYVVGLQYRGYPKTPSGEASSWSVRFAKDALSSKSSNCYQSAAVFAWLAKGLGYDAQAVCGTYTGNSGKSNSHGWTKVKIDGRSYIFDADNQRTADNHKIKKNYYKLSGSDKRYKAK